MRKFVVGLWAIVVIGTGLGIGAVQAQPTDDDYSSGALTSQERPFHIVVQPLYQYYEDEGRVLTEWSLPVQATVPLRQNVQLSLRASMASAGGDNLEQVTGLGDVQASLSYARPVGDGSIILSAGANLPSGKQELTLDEFRTVALLSRDFYSFRVPSFGQGLNVATGATWAFPVGEDVMLGLGGSFQLRGGYTPLQGMDDEYEPGNEVVLTGGLDYRLSRTSALSGDFAFTLYGTDMVGGVEQFEAGNKISATVQYLLEQGFSTFRLIGRYEGRGKSSIPAVAGAQGRALQTLPSQGTARASYQVRLNDALNLGLWAEGHLFEETDVYDSQTLVRLGVSPAWNMGHGVTLAPRAAVTVGSFTGGEGGLAVQWQQ